MSAVSAAPGSRTAVRLEVEEFLFAEAELIDAWRLDEWLELFSPEGRWVVPSTGLPDGDPERSLYLINDDAFILRHRISGLMGRTAYAESPKSRIRHLVTNVRASPVEARIAVRANFVVYRTRAGTTDTYVGEYHHVLERGGALGFRFLERRCVLDHTALRPQSSVSFIL
jgi:p-cumate 2,3-dioxygenase beta subunit